MKKKQGCPSGKIRYRDHLEAVRGLHSTQRAKRYSSQRREVRSYLCQVCSGWHLTSQADRKSLIDPASLMRPWPKGA